MVRSFVPLMVASGALVLVGFSPRVLEVREQTNGSSNGSAPVASANGSGELVVAGSCPAGTFPD
ncbi:MAG: hypothetical protein ACXWUG_05385, partial [Polyangiales bacterium]